MSQTVKVEVDWNEFVEMIVNADLARSESHKAAPNSYGAGYDQGYYDGLQKCSATLGLIDQTNLQGHTRAVRGVQ
jgi:hypothetical protein